MCFFTCAKSACRSCRSYCIHVDLFLFLIPNVYIKNKNIFSVVRYMVNVWMRFLLQWLLSVEIQKRNAVLMTYRCIPDRTLRSAISLCLWHTMVHRFKTFAIYIGVALQSIICGGVSQCSSVSMFKTKEYMIQFTIQYNTLYNSPYNTIHRQCSYNTPYIRHYRNYTLHNAQYDTQFMIQ